MRTNSHQKIDDRVFSLASNLFGFGNTQAKKEAEEIIAIENAISLQLDNRIIAVYPAIIEEAFSTTMDNYRKYIASYNFKTQAENELIQLHNTSVEQFPGNVIASMFGFSKIEFFDLADNDVAQQNVEVKF